MLKNIQDEELLLSCREQVLIEKSAKAKVLEFLNEIDRRRLWVKEGYGSMYDFCIRYLGYSEGEANRRILVIKEHFPERGMKKEYFEVEIDEEMKSLLEEARKLAGEKDNELFLKKVLKAYVREKRERKVDSKHTRRVAVPTAREVKKKAGFRCEFVSLKGIRCSQKAHLEIDHIRPWALGGSSKDTQNLGCLCKVHNLYFAKQYFPAIGKLGESQKSR